MNELELSTEELFPPTREELEEILETIQKQLEDPKFERTLGVFTSAVFT